VRFEHETRWLRRARAHLRSLFPNLPGLAAYNKRLRRSAEQLQTLIRVVATDADLWTDESLAHRLQCPSSAAGRARQRSARVPGSGQHPE
jgi:hypothetical protein